MGSYCSLHLVQIFDKIGTRSPKICLYPGTDLTVVSIGPGFQSSTVASGTRSLKICLNSAFSPTAVKLPINCPVYQPRSA
eukprot:2015160-Rhodomonas_salina.1